MGIPALAIAASALFTCSCVDVRAEGENDSANAALLENAKKNLPQLRQESLATLEQSRKNDPQQFKAIANSVGTKAFEYLQQNLRPIDMSRVRNTGYAVYNMDIWRFPGVAGNLHGLALGYNLPECPLAGKPEALAKAVEAFEWLLNIAEAKGSCESPDPNTDRFAYVQYWDAFVLMSPALPEALRDRFAKFLLKAADYQVSTFGPRKFPWGGGYPNMDAAYTLIMEQASRLFGKPEYGAEVDHRIEMLQKRIYQSTWEYLADWNPQAGYTSFTLGLVGRLYQLSSKPSVLKQIQQHATFYTYHIEPSGYMEYAMTPAIKHDWALANPYVPNAMPLELVNRYASTPALRTQVEKMRQAVPNPTAQLMLYWLSDNSGPKAPLPTDFVRQTPDFAGFQARITKNGGTFTAYGTGKKIAVDTRVTALVSAQAPENNAGLAGVFLEVIHNGMSYFLGSMKPEVALKTDARSAMLTVTEDRHAMGPLCHPLMMGNHHDDIKNWKYGCWEGGSPDSPPVETKEQWAWAADRLTGDLTVTAKAETALDGLKITLPVILRTIDETKPITNGQAYRFGDLCFSVQTADKQWNVPNTTNFFDFRADVPAGSYTVTLISGAPDFPTDPFDVLVNGKKAADGVQAPKGTFTERTFKAESKDGAICLSFLPLKGGNHWKISTIAITSADGKYSKKFVIGANAQPGVTPLHGADVYNAKSGYGWSHNLANGERHNPSAAPALAELISAPSERNIVLDYAKARTWQKGDTTQVHIVVGMGGSLDSWLAEATNKKPGK